MLFLVPLCLQMFASVIALRSCRSSAKLKMTRTMSNDLTGQTFERKLWGDGYKYVIGVDEAGRGPLAGPVVAASLVCLKETKIDARDSKALSEKKREKIYAEVMGNPDTYKVEISIIDHKRIDEINILKATMECMQSCIESMVSVLDVDEETKAYALVDGNKMPPRLTIPARTIVKGDSKVQSIALASIMAKVTRDRIMLEYDKEYPGYGFAKHKGYPTREHIMNIHSLGPCPIHRMTFKPLKGR